MLKVLQKKKEKVEENKLIEVIKIPKVVEQPTGPLCERCGSIMDLTKVSDNKKEYKCPNCGKGLQVN